MIRLQAGENLVRLLLQVLALVRGVGLIEPQVSAERVIDIPDPRISAAKDREGLNPRVRPSRDFRVAVDPRILFTR